MINVSINKILSLAAPVLPVVTFASSRHAVLLARALARGGLKVIEVTLRTAAAYEAVARIRAEVPELIVGVGSVVASHQLHEAQAAGAQFAVSPGLLPMLVREAAQIGLPYLPGVMTPSDMLSALDLGCETVKLFPASIAGGVDLLKAVRGPISQIQFCPTGGVDGQSFSEYLTLDNVVCVGGSWFISREIAQEDWEGVTRSAKIVSAMMPAAR
jgi:2-dehydro-3-deoxyphosphogluconate aldolase/(4S)-4-hydroxy-2-oxoglutarate aldolase